MYRGRHGLQGHNFGRPCLCVPTPPALACSNTNYLAIRCPSRLLGLARQTPNEVPTRAHALRSCRGASKLERAMRVCEADALPHFDGQGGHQVLHCRLRQGLPLVCALRAERGWPRGRLRRMHASPDSTAPGAVCRFVCACLTAPSLGADCSAQGPQGQSEASLFVLQGALHVCSRAPPTRPLPAPCGWWRESRGLHVPRTDGTVCAGGRKGR